MRTHRLLPQQGWQPRAVGQRLRAATSPGAELPQLWSAARSALAQAAGRDLLGWGLARLAVGQQQPHLLGWRLQEPKLLAEVTLVPALAAVERERGARERLAVVQPGLPGLGLRVASQTVEWPAQLPAPAPGRPGRLPPPPC